MAIWFLLMLIGLPIVEISVFIEAGEHFGLLLTISGIFATAIIGMVVIRIQGLVVLSRAQESLKVERFPGREVFDGVCLLIAGAMLVTPGFVTDSFGFLLLIVPLRRWAGAQSWRYAEKRGFTQATTSTRWNLGSGSVIDGEFHEVDGEPDNTGKKTPPTHQLPSMKPEDGHRDS